LNAHLRRRPIRYIGFNGTGYQTRDAFHPCDLAALLIAQMRTGRSNGDRIYTAGGGPANAMSLAQLTAWCDHRFGRHAPAADPEPRKYDLPWVVMDNTRAARDFGWQIEMSLPTILDGIAQHACDRPDWLDVSGA
jgi:CDP-paratose 2-epimerase